MLVVNGWRGSDPRVIGRSPVLEDLVWDLDTMDQVVALAVGEAGAMLLDLSNPRLPRVTHQVGHPGLATQVVLVGGRLWVGGDKGLQVFEVAPDGLTPLWQMPEAIEGLASDGHVVAALPRGASGDEVWVWGDGATAVDLADDMQRLSVDTPRNVAVARGRVMIAGGRVIAVHDRSADPPWSETARLELADQVDELSASGNEAIAGFLDAASALHVPQSGPPQVLSRVGVPEWPEAVWVDDGAIAVALVGGGLRLHDAGTVGAGGEAPVRAVLDTGPDVFRNSSQREGRTLLNGNWGRVWQALPGTALRDGLPLVHRFDLPVVNPIEALELGDTGDSIVAATRGPASNSTSFEVRDPEVADWAITSSVRTDWSVDDVKVVAPSAPGDPSLVLAPAGGRVYGADLSNGRIGAFARQRELPGLFESVDQLVLDERRLWLVIEQFTVQVFDRVGGSWVHRTSLELDPPGGPVRPRLLPAGDSLFVLFGSRLSRWDIRDPLQPVETQSLELSDAVALGWTDPTGRDELWVSARDGALWLVDVSGDGLHIAQALKTTCTVTAWIPVTDGAFAPAWGCGVYALRRSPAHPVATGTASPEPDPTASPSPSPPSPSTTPTTPDLPIPMRIFIPWAHTQG
jgi:hypothetical protein